MKKRLIERFEKDIKGSLTAMLIIGIIIKEERVWSFQIKKKLKEITNNVEEIKNSSLYTLLDKLENDYQIISSFKDEEIQRRFFSITEYGKIEFFNMKQYWYDFINNSKKYLDHFKEDRID